jgi:hypothetical protein
MRSCREHKLKGRRVQIRRHGPCGVAENINLKEGESRSEGTDHEELQRT